jgi:hypothetical protein
MDSILDIPEYTINQRTSTLRLYTKTFLKLLSKYYSDRQPEFLQTLKPSMSIGWYYSLGFTVMYAFLDLTSPLKYRPSYTYSKSASYPVYVRTMLQLFSLAFPVPLPVMADVLTYPVISLSYSDQLSVSYCADKFAHSEQCPPENKPLLLDAISVLG